MMYRYVELKGRMHNCWDREQMLHTLHLSWLSIFSSVLRQTYHIKWTKNWYISILKRQYVFCTPISFPHPLKIMGDEITYIHFSKVLDVSV